jgi:hypothetical protein
MHMSTNLKNSFTAILLLGVLLTQFFPAPQNASAAACDAILFIADVTVPDGSSYSPNATFTKTWRLKNIGTCTWTTSYMLVFVSGAQMGGPAEVNLTSTVAPAATIDLSVNLTAPVPAGSYRGYWQLKNAAGTLFGLGATADKPFWVAIVTRPGSVVTPVPVGESYNFATQAGLTQSWMSGAGLLPFPGMDGDPRGFALKLDSVKLETGATVNQPALLMVPQNKTDGYIQGLYPSLAIQDGDRFQTTIGCQYGSMSCYVTYRIDYRTNAGVKTLWTFRERYEGLTYNVNIDLSFLAGKNVEFFLMVLASGSPAGDRAVWVAPRIVRVPPTPTPTPEPPRMATASIDVVLPVSVTCGGPNAVGIVATITTIGATTVTYHWEMVADQTIVTPNESLTFSTAGTQTVNPGAYSADCGVNHTARIVLTSPNYWSALIYYSIIPSLITPSPTPTAIPQGVTAVTAVVNVPEFKNCAGIMTVESIGDITTDGPATVSYHWETGGITTNTTPENILVFPSASTLPVNINPFTVGCGNYFARLVVTSPNVMSAQANILLSIPTVLPIYDFTTVQIIGTMSCSDVANYGWDSETGNGESGGYWVSQTPLFGKDHAGFLRYDGNTICGLNLP